MKHTFKTGLSFGLTSGIITTLGLMVGLKAGTDSQLAVLGGVIVIAIADALSDAVGIHLSEEAEHVHSEREIWEATIATFLTKFLTAMSFIVPLLALPLELAVPAAIAWGVFLMSAFSYYIARGSHLPAWKIVAEHLLICLIVLAASQMVGSFVSRVFG